MSYTPLPPGVSHVLGDSNMTDRRYAVHTACGRQLDAETTKIVPRHEATCPDCQYQAPANPYRPTLLRFAYMRLKRQIDRLHVQAAQLNELWWTQDDEDDRDFIQRQVERIFARTLKMAHACGRIHGDLTFDRWQENHRLGIS